MNESFPTTESISEHIPTHEEVQALFEILLDGKEFEDIMKKEDEKGLYMWNIRLKELNKEGEFVYYTYMRAGRYDEGQANYTAIFTVFSGTDGVSTGGRSVAKYDGSEWVYT